MNHLPDIELPVDRSVTGKALARELRNAPPAARAVRVLRLCNGTALRGLTPTQAAAVGRVGVYSVATANSASPAEREGLRSGTLSLKAVRRAHRRLRPLSDAEVLTTIKQIGADRVLAAIDAMTAPDLPMNTPDLAAELQPAMAAE